MLAKVLSSTITGIDAVPVEVEVKACPGPNRFTIIGLADNAVKESRDRVISAISHSGFNIPEQVLVSLSPAELKKEGSAFDLPIAIGVLVASRQVPSTMLKGISFHGELSLDGQIKKITGALAYATRGAQSKIPYIVLPAENARESKILNSIQTVGVHSLQELALFLKSESIPILNTEAPATQAVIQLQDFQDFSDVCGQDSAKRALLIAASGEHNLLMVGPPGCGKSMLARRFPSILPPLLENEMLEVIKIHSIASQNVEPFLAGLRPFRSPHYNISMAGLVGGGVNLRPGEISLAHHGILFLDEFPEFQRGAIEALRVPLEYGSVDISRAKGSQRFPARFQLIAAMNPCPCGRLGIEGAHCTCSPAFLQTYIKKLSQPILDRIDMHIEVPRIPFDVIKQNSSTDCDTTSLTLKSKVISTRKVQLARSKMLNAHISSRSALRFLNESPSRVQHLLESVQKKLGLSARGIIRSIKVARTIADLETSEHIQEHHLAEALGYRYLERMERFYSR